MIFHSPSPWLPSLTPPPPWLSHPLPMTPLSNTHSPVTLSHPLPMTLSHPLPMTPLSNTPSPVTLSHPLLHDSLTPHPTWLSHTPSPWLSHTPSPMTLSHPTIHQPREEGGVSGTPHIDEYLDQLSLDSTERLTPPDYDSNGFYHRDHFAWVVLHY